MFPIVWSAIAPTVIRFLKHFVVYIAIAIVIAAPIYIAYQQGYKKGFAKGSEKPTNTFTAPSVVNNFGHDPKDRPWFIGPKIAGFGIGIEIDRN